MSFAVVVQYFSKVSHILCLSRREFVTYWPLPLVWLICVMYGRAVSSSVWCLDFPDQLGTTELSLWSLFLNLTWLLYLWAFPMGSWHSLVLRPLTSSHLASVVEICTTEKTISRSTGRILFFFNVQLQPLTRCIARWKTKYNSSIYFRVPCQTLVRELASEQQHADANPLSGDRKTIWSRFVILVTKRFFCESRYLGSTFFSFLPSFLPPLPVMLKGAPTLLFSRWYFSVFVGLRHCDGILSWWGRRETLYCYTVPSNVTKVVAETNIE